MLGLRLLSDVRCGFRLASLHASSGTLVLSLVLSPAVAFASGYAVYEQGVAAMANGGALSARANDPSALYFNPAGILQLEGVNLYGGVTPIFRGGSSVRSATTGRTFHQESGP